MSAADKVLVTFGPDEGRITEPDQGLIIASASIIAHDMVSLTWLLENRQNLKLEGTDWIKDPEPLVARSGNQYVVHKLSGWRPVVSSEKLIQNELESVKDDRVLNRACPVLGGAPQVTFFAANGGSPDGIRERLAEKANGNSV
ncbi:MAG: hypothetical protein JXA41_16195 [Deltaproteobacteria bacterium]|nr:hypothetical protein [Deltaproteobacteria bacterium]